MQHCKIVSIGDCSKVEAREYYTDLLRHVPDELKKDLSFEEVYRVFGGKLAHINGESPSSSLVIMIVTEH